MENDLKQRVAEAMRYPDVMYHFGQLMEEVSHQLEWNIARIKNLTDENNELKEVIESKRKLTKEIDIVINGDNAAEQASLCDLIGQIKHLKDYCPDMNAFYNGYAQAQADGVQIPLSDEDLQIGIEMQLNKIKALTEREEKLVEALKHIANYKDSIELWKDVTVVDATFVFELAKITLKDLGIEP